MYIQVKIKKKLFLRKRKGGNMKSSIIVISIFLFIGCFGITDFSDINIPDKGDQFENIDAKIKDYDFFKKKLDYYKNKSIEFKKVKENKSNSSLLLKTEKTYLEALKIMWQEDPIKSIQTTDNEMKAINKYKEAYIFGNVAAACRIGEYYLSRVYDKEYFHRKAFNWFVKASAFAYRDALYNLGVMFANGFYVEKDLKLANKFFLHAAKKGNAYAMHNIGVMYYNGYYYEQNIDKAFKWFLKAADNGSDYSAWLVMKHHLIKEEKIYKDCYKSTIFKL